MTRRIVEPACGDHPALLLADVGDLGTIVGYSLHFRYMVQTDANLPGSRVAVLPQEFVVVTD